MMKHHLLLWGLLLLATAASAQGTNTPGASDLIPKPLYGADKPGTFTITPSVTLHAPSPFKEAATLLAERLRLSSAIVRSKRKASIVFMKANEKDSLGREGYLLSITPSKISITAATALGATNATFTLLQLQLLQPDAKAIPCAEIRDIPRFGYRGMHLDVSRNFFPVDFIKKYIDLMALYKYNTFHWHLTDNAGWRLEIKKYPLLTVKAAFRTHLTRKEWWSSGRKFADEGSPNAYGGYYTQEEAREVVAYAAQRGITVIPEIEMPGHSDEVLAVYPQLACSGLPYQNGELCIGNPQTFSLMEDVLKEVIGIFPSTYIHVGGDEAEAKAWKGCPKCQALMKEKGLANEHELQAYLIKHMEQFLKDHGRRLIGWDEIVDGGLPADATVMNWRGESYGIKAVEQNHDVVMAPSDTYFDYYQSNPATQPEAIGGYLPIQRVYAIEPVPAALSALQGKHVLGIQGNLWTEFMPTTYQVEYMAYPRAIALAEVAWSAKEKKNFDDFQRRLQHHYLLLQRCNVNYYRPSNIVTVAAQPDYERKQNLVSFTSEQYQPEIRYTLDGSQPTATSPLYQKPFYTSGQTEVKAAIFKNGAMQGSATSQTTSYHLAIGKKVTFNTMWSNAYPAQKEQTLTNGIAGTITYRDKQWLGYLKDFDVTVDMEQAQPISSVAIRFMQQPGPGVLFPAYVELLVSEDGKTFTTVKKEVNTIPTTDPALQFKTFTFDCGKANARYIRLFAPKVAGFMFTDEVVVF
jgi:hexosaminidase